MFNTKQMRHGRHYFIFSWFPPRKAQLHDWHASEPSIIISSTRLARPKEEELHTVPEYGTYGRLRVPYPPYTERLIPDLPVCVIQKAFFYKKKMFHNSAIFEEVFHFLRVLRPNNGWSGRCGFTEQYKILHENHVRVDLENGQAQDRLLAKVE